MMTIRKYLILRVKDFKVIECDRAFIKDFIEKYHYSKSINGCITDYCYALLNNDTLIGALFYGRLPMANQWKRFTNNPNDIIELRRLVCIDDTPKNTESFFIAKTLKLLKKSWNGSIVVSYADLEYNHVGTIYKASNFTYLGLSQGAKVIIFNNKIYHDKAIRTKYKGELKPFAKRLKLALESGEAFYKKTKGKHTYIYRLKK